MAAGLKGTLGGSFVCALVCGPQAVAEPFVRPAPHAGAVVTARGGEELKFPTDAVWRSVEPAQNLVGGDTVRTNALGAVSILFGDRTQIRVGRNSTLVVKDIARGPAGETLLSLPEGDVFARAARGGAGVRIDTPAAAAAVRGTDWSLSVRGAKTGLVVLEGEVTLANPQGSVTVRQGEGAEALVGQAPRKFTLVNYKGRTQLLLYRELRDGFFDLSPSDLPRPQERALRARLLATPEDQRSADDWLALAELALVYDGGDAARLALERAAISRRLTLAQQSRADFVRGFLAGRDADWPKAVDLFAQARPRLSPARRDTAAYVGWIAAALSDPTKKPAPLPAAGAYAGSPQGEFARAVVESFTENNQRGVDILAEASKRHPDDLRLVAGRAALLLSQGDKEAAAREIERARAIDPDDPYFLLLEARYLHTIESDLDSAKANVERALKAAPGFALAWAELGLIEGQRNAAREAEAAHLKAISLNPKNVTVVANYATFLINRNEIGAADRVIAEVERIDPSSLPALLGRGRILVRQGKAAEGLEKLLAASTVNPTYADGLIDVAVAQYQLGAMDGVGQALDNADRYDDDNPETPLVRSVIAADLYRADEAILAAREALRRRLARGGYYGKIESDRQNGSPINNALRFLDLDDWGRYYSDRTFDSFSATSYFDQARASQASPFAAVVAPPIDDGASGAASLSSTVQGLLLEPLAAAASERRQQLVHTSFAEVAVGGGPRFEGADVGWSTDATLQAKSMGDTPFAIYLTAGLDHPDSPDPTARSEGLDATAYAGAQLTPFDNVIVLAGQSDAKADFHAVDPFSLVPDRLKSEETQLGAGWSHTFNDRNVLRALGGGTIERQSQTGDSVDGGYFLRDGSARQETGFGAVGHLVGVGDVALRYGLEGGRVDQTTTDRRFYPPPSRFGELRVNVKGGGEVGLAYADALWDVTPGLKVEGGVFASQTEFTSRLSCEPVCGDVRTKQRGETIDLRVGAAWEAVRGHWLRAAYLENTAFDSDVTLSPVTTIGLAATELPQEFGGSSKTLAARWDAEWSKHVFMALEYQSQKAGSLGFSLPESLESVDATDARVRRLEASANVWLTHGVGLFGRYARTWAEAKGRADLPFVAQDVGRVGVSFVHPSMVKVTLAETFVGRRKDGAGRTLGDYAVTDASITWEAFDKRLVLGLFALNIFDRRYVIQTGYVASGPYLGVADIAAQGRTVFVTARLRL